MKNFKKITYDLLDESDYRYEKTDLVDKVKEYIQFEVMNYELGLLQSLIECESPVEQLFALALENMGLTSILINNPDIDVLGVENQKVIVIDDKKYRVDFCIPVQYKKGKSNKFKQFVVEIDGHEFHQKTKKQVESDNERTRALQIAGYEVVRFSGTEIYHKPHKAVRTLISLILSKAND